MNNLIDNATKYSGAANISIGVKTDKKTMVLIITDDGTGFDIDKKQSGNGLKNMHRRAAALQGNLVIQSVLGNGTTVKLRFNY